MEVLIIDSRAPLVDAWTMGKIGRVSITRTPHLALFFSLPDKVHNRYGDAPEIWMRQKYD